HPSVPSPVHEAAAAAAFRAAMSIFFVLSIASMYDHRSTMTLNPPQNMRLPSKGIAFGSIIFARRLSFMTLALTRSRCARDLYTTYANTTVSPDLSLTLCGNDVRLPGFTSSAAHS